MKKLSKTLAAISALALILSAGMFVSCSDSDDSDNTTQTPSGDNASTTTPTDTTGDKGGSVEQTVSVTSAWNFKEGANASKNATLAGYGTTAKKPTSEITIDADSGSGATLTLLVQDGCSVKYNTGLQWGAGTKETDVMTVTTDAACTLEVVGKGSSGDSWTSAKPNSFSVNGTSVYARAAASETSEQTWTVSLNKGDNTIAVSGMKFISFTCK